MGTNGVLSVQKNDKTIVKAVVGCNGYNVSAAKHLVIKRNAQTVEDVYAAALEVEFGCTRCLVVFDEAGNQINMPEDEDTASRYWSTFSDPQFNPRWSGGEVEYRQIAHLGQVGGSVLDDPDFGDWEDESLF